MLEGDSIQSSMPVVVVGASNQMICCGGSRGGCDGNSGGYALGNAGDAPAATVVQYWARSWLSPVSACADT